MIREVASTIADGARAVLQGFRRVRCAVSPWHDTLEVVGYTERGPMLRCRRCGERW